MDIMPTWEYYAGVREGWIVEVSLDAFGDMITALVEALDDGLEVSLTEVADFGNEQFDSALSGTASSE